MKPKPPKPAARLVKTAASRPATAPPARVRETTLSDYSNDKRNANKGTLVGETMVETSMRRFGAGRSGLADSKGRMIAGNKTLRAAKAAGITRVIEIETEGDAFIVHKRTDLDLDTDADARALSVADNQAASAGLEWDAAILQAMKEDDVPLGDFFSPSEWAALTQDAGDDAAKPSPHPEMELQPFEEYDYVMLLFRNSQDLQRAHDLLGITHVQVTVGKSVKIGLGRVVDGARAVEKLLDAGKKAPR